MAVILRRESFGGLIGDTTSYDVRLLNHAAYCQLTKAISPEGQLDPNQQRLLAEAGFASAGQKVRVVSKELSSQGPLLSAPLILWLELTSYCPLRCKHCFINCGSSAPHTEIDFAHVSRILREAAEMGVLRITLTGGEALCYGRIAETLSLIRDLQLGLRLFTNAVLNSRSLEILANSGADGIFVSVDGSSEHHDALRGRNTYHHVLKTLRELERRGLSDRVTLSVTLDRGNAKHFDSVLRLATDHGVRTILLRPLMAYSWTPGLSDLFFSNKAELHHAITEAQENAARREIEVQLNKIPYLPLESGVRLHDHANNSSIWRSLGIDTSIDCVGGNVVCGVRYDGVVVPCGFIDVNHSCEENNSIAHNSLSQLWKSAPNLTRMRRIKVNAACSKCSVRALCGGGCRGNAVNNGDSISGIDPYCLYEDTAFGDRLLVSAPGMQDQGTGVPQDGVFVSKRRVVSKCGWASYV